jgi:hypothetical protein
MFNELKEFNMAKNQPIPLDADIRSYLSTYEAAHHLNRREQTLRMWACLENGPIRPIRVNRRLAWPTLEIKRLLAL